MNSVSKLIQHSCVVDVVTDDDELHLTDDYISNWWNGLMYISLWRCYNNTANNCKKSRRLYIFVCHYSLVRQYASCNLCSWFMMMNFIWQWIISQNNSKHTRTLNLITLAITGMTFTLILRIVRKVYYDISTYTNLGEIAPVIWA